MSVWDNYEPTPEEAAEWDRYEAELHAVQSGVAIEMQLAPARAGTSPKSLRVGIASAMVNDAALVQLLVEKGVITMLEYATACADSARAERQRYEARLAEMNGGHSKITLG